MQQNPKRTRIHTAYNEDTETWVVKCFIPPITITAGDLATALDIMVNGLSEGLGVFRVELVIDSDVLLGYFLSK